MSKNGFQSIFIILHSTVPDTGEWLIKDTACDFKKPAAQCVEAVMASTGGLQTQDKGTGDCLGEDTVRDVPRIC